MRDSRRTGVEPARPPASPADGVHDRDATRPLELAEVGRRIADLTALLTKLEQQIAARSRALPIYKQTLATDGLTRQLRVQRDHPVHILLRRMYHESQARAEGA